MIVCLSGLAGTGKSAVADILVKEHGFAAVAFADPLKRIAKDVYGFNYDQLWGSSEKRSEPDKRYPREHTFPDGDLGNKPCECCGVRPGADVIFKKEECQCYLTVRYALQKLGTEWGRNCYNKTWTDYAIRVAKSLIENPSCNRYSNQTGLTYNKSPVNIYGVVLTDARFINEIKELEKAGAFTIRVKRTGYEKPQWDHASETEQLKMKDEDFAHILNNFGSLKNLGVSVGEMIHEFNEELMTM